MCAQLNGRLDSTAVAFPSGVPQSITGSDPCHPSRSDGLYRSRQVGFDEGLDIPALTALLPLASRNFERANKMSFKSTYEDISRQLLNSLLISSPPHIDVFVPAAFAVTLSGALE